MYVVNCINLTEHSLDTRNERNIVCTRCCGGCHGSIKEASSGHAFLNPNKVHHLSYTHTIFIYSNFIYIYIYIYNSRKNFKYELRRSKLISNQSESNKIALKLIKNRNNFWKVISNNLKKKNSSAQNNIENE